MKARISDSSTLESEDFDEREDLLEPPDDLDGLDPLELREDLLPESCCASFDFCSLLCLTVGLDPSGSDGGNTSDKEILGSSLPRVCVSVSFDVRPLTTLDPRSARGRGGRNSEIDIREAFLDALCDDCDPREDVAETTLDFGEALSWLLLRDPLSWELDCDTVSFPLGEDTSG